MGRKRFGIFLAASGLSLAGVYTYGLFLAPPEVQNLLLKLTVYALVLALSYVLVLTGWTVSKGG